jgi:glycosyltransferase involved in cell wall biosynthesis
LHGIEAWGLTDKNRRQGLAGANVLLPVSRYTRDVVGKEQAIALERFRILPNAFDPSVFRIGPKPGYLLKRYGLAPDQPVILTVGRLDAAERYKGQDRILRILSEIREQISEVRYLIVGDGNDRPRLRKLAEELGLTDSVIFAGKVPEGELNDHYNLCDLFAMPSTVKGLASYSWKRLPVANRCLRAIKTAHATHCSMANLACW